jgi:hypothetical protein
MVKATSFQNIVTRFWGRVYYGSDEVCLNLGQLTTKRLAEFKQYLTDYGGEGKTNTPGLLRDVALYESLRQANTTLAIMQKRPRALEQMVPMLCHLACKLPGQRLWAREDDSSENGVWLPYLITRASYEHASRDNPAYVRLRMKYVQHGSIREQIITWHWCDVQGRSLQATLADEGYYAPTPAVLADYEYDLELFHEYIEVVGRQFNASGWGWFQGVDDELDGESRHGDGYRLSPAGLPTRVVRDVNNEADKKPERGSMYVEDIRMWFEDTDEDGEPIELDYERDEEGNRMPPVPPTHPYIICHDMDRHRRVAIHARNLTPYQYNTKLAEQLVLPEGHKNLIDLLTRTNARAFNDVVSNKAGGVVIICQGLPGTGKTLTAEVISEVQERPLYSVQCSQLGIEVDDIESNLMAVLKRASRWNAVTLLDEADVYLMARGSSLSHNAIVGVFLRVLEYAAGTLFLTTNRLDAMDDAITSRAVAVLHYGVPPVADRVRIWHNLLAANNVPGVSGAGVLALAQLPLSGRDIKNNLKLCLLMGREVTCSNIEDLLQYRPYGTDKHKKEPQNDTATRQED